MDFFDRTGAIIVKDLKAWIRTPFLPIIAVIPLLIVSTAIGLFIAQAEVMPSGLIIEDDTDPQAIEIAEFIKNMQSGTGSNWFYIEDLSKDEVISQFKNGKILSYIVIPSNITSRIESGEIVSIHVVINNINDDITKNVMQRLEFVSNHFNREVIFNSNLTLGIKPKFETGIEQDYTFKFYALAGATTLAVILTGAVNTANNFSVEIEKKTLKNLVMISSPYEIITGKFLTGIIQSFIGLGVILLFNYIVFGFFPNTDILILVVCILWGFVSFSTIGLIMVLFIKKTIPSAIAILLLVILSWYVGGGLVPAEVWPPVIKVFASLLPTTYFFRSFIQFLLTGYVDSSILFFDIIVTLSFGLITLLIAFRIFLREVKV
ncbi:MAG: ABC transporter permease [Candidatus Hodarchaeales archaeon]|jgi:ABC-type multidrug transport system permease subunit